MENTRSKNRKHKNYTKQKRDVDEKESHIFNSVDKIRPGRMPITPVSPVGNIVDMQGSLDHGSVDKNEEEKNESKINNNKSGDKDSNECDKAVDSQKMNKKEDKDDKDASSKDVENEVETIESNNVSENVDTEDKTISEMDTRSIEKENIVDQKNTDETCESIKQSVSENQGIYCFHYLE